MANPPQTCAKCGGKMKQGFVVDHSRAAIFVSHWVAGAPEKSFWTRTKVSRRGQVPIGTFRCSSCGFLESYARDEFASQ